MAAATAPKHQKTTKRNYRKSPEVKALEALSEAMNVNTDNALYPLSHKSQSIIELMMTIIGLMTTIINNIEALFRGRLYPGSL